MQNVFIKMRKMGLSLVLLVTINLVSLNYLLLETQLVHSCKMLNRFASSGRCRGSCFVLNWHLLRALVAEVLEDLVRGKAMREGEATGEVSRERVSDLLEGRA
ncbi:MAG: hypothetical protein KatS3mg082_3400 [Nitrospiraceae bacterium]|nr:MAG: hypothetical protein KatS3mg082_3400 [Nitrospiraceae bacterium]